MEKVVKEVLVDIGYSTDYTIINNLGIQSPDIAQGVETLTQRYWETMLSRTVIVGHAPKELIDICGYNPVLELPDDKEQINTFILNIIYRFFN